MRYRKITLEVVVKDDESEVLVQALNDVMDRLEDQITVFDSGIVDVETEEPENAEEIGATAN